MFSVSSKFSLDPLVALELLQCLRVFRFLDKPDIPREIHRQDFQF